MASRLSIYPDLKHLDTGYDRLTVWIGDTCVTIDEEPDIDGRPTGRIRLLVDEGPDALDIYYDGMKLSD